MTYRGISLAAVNGVSSPVSVSRGARPRGDRAVWLRDRSGRPRAPRAPSPRGAPERHSSEEGTVGQGSQLASQAVESAYPETRTTENATPRDFKDHRKRHPKHRRAIYSLAAGSARYSLAAGSAQVGSDLLAAVQRDVPWAAWLCMSRVLAEGGVGALLASVLAVHDSQSGPARRGEAVEAVRSLGSGFVDWDGDGHTCCRKKWPSMGYLNRDSHRYGVTGSHCKLQELVWPAILVWMEPLANSSPEVGRARARARARATRAAAWARMGGGPTTAARTWRRVRRTLASLWCHRCSARRCPGRQRMHHRSPTSRSIHELDPGGAVRVVRRTCSDLQRPSVPARGGTQPISSDALRELLPLLRRCDLRGIIEWPIAHADGDLASLDPPVWWEWHARCGSTGADHYEITLEW